jgi:hypothetical protein
MERPQQCLAFQGTLLHTPGEPGSVQVLADYLIIVNNEGIIVHLAPAGDRGEWRDHTTGFWRDAAAAAVVSVLLLQ